MMSKINISSKVQLIILVLFAIGLNANTLFHQYAYDDEVVMNGNKLVKEGLKGIPALLTTEYFYGLLKKQSDLTGARYRPFSLIMFALEYQCFGANPFVSHLLNMLLFALLIALLFLLLQRYV